jgi:tRNA (mo5U34)-methyltransferase
MDDLRRAAAEHDWYHAIDLGEGQVTDGWFDLRPYVDRYGLPDDLTGKRCLDVGTWDGFWAFELERRGAAEVVALDLEREEDLDWPPRRRAAIEPDHRRGAGFRLAHQILGSRVERVERSIYHTTPEELGTFDLVVCGSVLIHLRDQLLALERIANLCSGTFVSAEEYDRLSSLLPFAVSRYRADDPRAVVFWRPNVRCWRRMLWSAGFERVERRGRFAMRASTAFSVPHVVFHAHTR